MGEPVVAVLEAVCTAVEHPLESRPTCGSWGACMLQSGSLGTVCLSLPSLASSCSLSWPKACPGSRRT